MSVQIYIIVNAIIVVVCLVGLVVTGVRYLDSGNPKKEDMK